jgi:arylsulfatase
MFPEDEDFDVGQDTRTGVALVEYRYDVPFKFTGKIDKLTFHLGPAQYTEEDRDLLPAIRDRVARSRD